MKLKKIAITSALTLAMATATVLAQGPRPGFDGGNFGARMVDRMSVTLGLTDAQKQTASTLFQEAQAAAKPVAAELKQNHQALQDAIKAGKSDAEITALANQQGVLMGQLAAIRAKNMAKFYAQLTPEQRQKADALHEGFRGHQRRDRPQTGEPRG